MENASQERKREIMVEKAMEEYEKRIDEIYNRVQSLKPLIHQNMAVINRYSLHDDTFMEQAPGLKKTNRRQSWNGMILAVSDLESEDPIIEVKKGILKANAGKTVLFNPESAYSLNIADFDEIWVMHIDGFLAFDMEHNQRAIKLKNAISKANITML